MAGCVPAAEVLMYAVVTWLPPVRCDVVFPESLCPPGFWVEAGGQRESMVSWALCKKHLAEQ